MNTTKPFLDFLCRTCMRELAELNTEQQWQSIFDTTGVGTSLPIAEMLSRAIPRIEVRINDELPKKICRKCLEQLQCIYLFQEMCIQSQQQMRDLITKANTDISIAVADAVVEHVISKLEDSQKNHRTEEEVEQQAIEFVAENILPEAKHLSTVDLLQYNDVLSVENNRIDVSKAVNDIAIEELISTREDLQHNTHNEAVKERGIEFVAEQILPEATQLLDAVNPLQCNDGLSLENRIDASKAVNDIAIEELISTREDSQHNHHTEEVKERGIEFVAEQILPEATQLLDTVNPLQCNDGLSLENSTDTRAVFIGNDNEHKVENNDGMKQLPLDIIQNEVMKVDTEEELNLPASTNICTICNKSFKQPRLLQYHLKRHKNEKSPKKKFEYFRYECNVCDRFFYKPESLHKHRLEHDSEKGIRTYICKVCNKTLSSAHTLWRHNKNQHSDKRDMTKKHQCEFCDKAFTLSAALKTHVRTHTGERPYLCPECGKAFSTSGQMTQHRHRHDTIKRFECPQCPLKFSCSSDLSKHKLVHDEVKRHACDICGDRFTKAHELKTHKMYHNGIKPYKCDYCDKRFVVGDAWRRHTRTHTGEKPYKCKYCDSAFAQSGDHIKHLRLHIGDNVYRCDLCPAAFRFATEKRLHFATHRNDDEETRERNKKALMEEEEKLAAKFAKRAQRIPVAQQLKKVDSNIPAMA